MSGSAKPVPGATLPGMSGSADWRRLLLVHAHPDDESIATGGIMAKYAAEGAAVTLVTCTLGEMGEVIPPELDHLRAERSGGLGAYRAGELAAACAELGVTDHRFLGGPGRWRDSGMMGTPANADPGCFWRADLDQAAAELTAVIRDVRPQVLVSYDANGFYGHPDLIQAHRVAWRGFERAMGHDWQVAKFYANAVPKPVLAEAIATVRAAETAFLSPPASVDELPFGVPDRDVTTEIDVSGYLGVKLAAMRAHATQISVDGRFYALSDNVGQLALRHEYFTLLAGPRGKGTGPADREDDLFGGLT
jgi:N-acetyl-1-D-myo-inositol-2-amino-2-deoxy-alpha-D-glucopyranoside deacetylase